jgi:hypothetical protein
MKRRRRRRRRKEDEKGEKHMKWKERSGHQRFVDGIKRFDQHILSTEQNCFVISKSLTENKLL